MASFQLDLEIAVDRMGSRELFVEVAKSFVDALPGTEQKIAEAIDAGTWREARLLAHSLKSNCAAMGAEKLREKVYVLEKACAGEDETSAAALFPVIREELRILREKLLPLIQNP